MLGHLITSAGNHEAGRGRDIKRVLTVTTCAYDIDIAVGFQKSRHTRLEDAVAEAEQLIYGDTSHLQTGQQSGNLFVGVL